MQGTKFLAGQPKETKGTNIDLLAPWMFPSVMDRPRLGAIKSGIKIVAEHPKPSYLWLSNVSFVLIEDDD